MAELKSQVVPLLPLTTGVVLPGMVVTIALETDEARSAIAAARSADQSILLVPRVEGRYARVGTIAQIEDVGRLPSGIEALVVRGLAPSASRHGRARDGRRDVDRGRADRRPRTDGARRGARSRVPRHRREHRGVAWRPAGGGVPARHHRAGRPGRHGRVLARHELRREGRHPRGARRRAPARARPRAREEDARRPRVEGQDPQRGHRRHRQAAARVPAARADVRDPQGARRGGAGGRRGDATARASPRPACPRRCRSRPSRSWAGWSAPPSRTPSTDGSARTSTGCWMSRGTSARRISSTSLRRGRSWTRTTRAWRT